MKITDEFQVDVPIDRAWDVLLDVEQIAPCMPGAQLDEVNGDEYAGTVKVKVGPITTKYQGTARVVEADEAARRIVIKASGRDTQRQGSASATITLLLTPNDAATNVALETDLDITGKVAQFGRGVMSDVSSRLLKQFVQSLHAVVLEDGDAPEPDRAEVENFAIVGSGSRDAVPIDIGRVALPSVAKRLVPVAALAIAAAIGIVWLANR